MQKNQVQSSLGFSPFGMPMPQRTFSTGYRFGFNGKEMDNEVKGQGTSYDYGFRIYDPRLGRFLSVDPLAKSFPFYSPYHFAGNSPILHIDLDGLEEVNSMTFIYDKTFNNRQLKKTEWLDIDRPSANGTFAEAAAYNTANKNSHLYQPINQIHNYYQWADEKLQNGKSGIRWFAAAEDVTAPFFGIGASQHWPGQIGGGFSKDAASFLAAGNSFLFGKNMGMMNDILEKGNFNGLTGKDADYAMVDLEQSTLTGFMKTYESKMGSKKFDSMIDNLNSALNDPLVELDYIKKAKETIGGDIDFRNQSHREVLGKSLVDEKHAE